MEKQLKENQTNHNDSHRTPGISYKIGIIIIFFGIIIDQITKYFASKLTDSITVIPNFLNFTLIKNYGAAFGIAQGANNILAILGAIISSIVLFMILYLNKKDGKSSIALYFILTGGIANLIDRVFRHFVVDFIDTPFIATFNIADSFVVIGAFLLIIEELCYSIFYKSK